ncbi:MAG: nitrous oxide reductase accessory protein NosL [Meiothermus sp.]|uniref:nitrous oxide reductase accessory protein NosL n=1 Tax=Meiothermus sp. TaxID=1955249 RepID=UPI0025E10AF9|nr:nitrous oxide reductase accessory protein NosL [Meiothermus sp.]MCS7058828.1 nitrous oxide reductase accessory protein NosL [Meiothermus sp.]MCS7194072.1 nitrous oxide reductase accessory protein NosL [Meiothermus sp.]MCX7740443.1 nitrous oxide reductase accessory protein NosL [Meiothermus sp.]MDW8091153.1 nitrous oxide reductase accessory protein NosL [Meiothermus sp.]MDW8480471.1 nitrous oxide reductase accessory protein NosL [Meiothermus sp.]
MKRRTLIKGLLALPLGSGMLQPVLAAARPLRVGVDACPYCNMTLLDARYAAQMVTSTGKVYQYDDVGCLLDHLLGYGGPKATPKELYVADFSLSSRKEARFLPVNQALFLFNERIRTPMGTGLLAFGSAAALEGYLRERPQHTGERLRWNDLLALGRRRAWVPGYGR